jgi:hypothetical protein
VTGLEDLTTLRVDVADLVATITIDRPPVNAQNGVFREEITRVFDVLHEADAVRAIVLTGAGRTFSAGADLKDRPDASRPGAFPRHSRAVRAGFDCVMECNRPVIAAVVVIRSRSRISSCCSSNAALDSACRTYMPARTAAAISQGTSCHAPPWSCQHSARSRALCALLSERITLSMSVTDSDCGVYRAGSSNTSRA